MLAVTSWPFWPKSWQLAVPVTGVISDGEETKGLAVAFVLTKQEDVQALDLQPTDYQAWRQLRTQLQYRQEARRKRNGGGGIRTHEGYSPYTISSRAH